MRCRTCLKYLRIPHRRITSWRVLYIPTFVFMAGLVYVHMMLVNGMRTQYFAIDGVSDGRSLAVQTTGTETLWAHHLGNTSRTGEIGKAKADVVNGSSLKVLSEKLVPQKQIALKDSINGGKLSEYIKPIKNGGSKNDSGVSIVSGIRRQVTNTKVSLLKTWEKKTVRECGGRFVGYSGYLVQLTDVLVIRSLATAEASGGEDIMSVTNRPEDAESYDFTPGFFSLTCPEGILRSKFTPDPHHGYIGPWYDALMFLGPIFPEPVTEKPKEKPKVVKQSKKKPIKNMLNGKNNNSPINNKLNNSKLDNNMPNNNKQNNNKLNNDIQNNNGPSKLGRRLLGVIAKGNKKQLALSNNKTGQLQVSNKKPLPKIPAKAKTKNITAVNITELVPPGSESKDTRFTIAITRYEYANLYWALMDIYDVFLTLTHFGYTPHTTQVLFLDAKPWSHMDALWSHFFGDVTRLAGLPRAVRFQQLIWGFQRAHSPMLERKPLLLNTNFRTQMLGAFNVTEPVGYSNGRYGKNCSSVGDRRLNVLFVWRRNYVAHPRNPSGMVSRKIANEAELLNATIEAFPMYNVRGEQLDKLDMREQVKIVSDTDVMIGMHGAAFAFAWFLPKGSGAVEMFPTNGGGNWHMRHIAEKNGVHYDVWKNKNVKNEQFHSKSTIIPPDVAIGLIQDMVKTICTNITKVTKPPPKKPVKIKQKPQQRPEKPAAKPIQSKQDAKVSNVESNVKHQGVQPQKPHGLQGIVSDKELERVITPRPIGLQMPPQITGLQDEKQPEKAAAPKNKTQSGKLELPAPKRQSS